jgi:hypothetical protein
MHPSGLLRSEREPDAGPASWKDLKAYDDFLCLNAARSKETPQKSFDRSGNDRAISFSVKSIQ